LEGQGSTHFQLYSRLVGEFVGLFYNEKIVVCYVNGSYLTNEKSLMIIFFKKTSMRKEIVLGLEIFFI
jgi:hypothetical protein